MTTRSQKRKAVEELVSTEIETPIPETSQNLNPVAGTSKSPRVLTENLEEIKSSLRKEIMSDLTKILAENQKEMLKLIAPPVKKQTIITAAEETDSESENIPENATSTPIKNKTTATTRKITPVNSRNTYFLVLTTFICVIPVSKIFSFQPPLSDFVLAFSLSSVPTADVRYVLALLQCYPAIPASKNSLVLAARINSKVGTPI